MRHSVIIIEDDKDLRGSLVDCLEMAGFEARGVGSAREFYNRDKNVGFTVAIVDIGLPDQSGFSLAEYIRNNTSMGVLILTARDSLEDRVHGYECGADQYFVKPIRCRELAAAVKSLACRRRPDAEDGEGTGWRLNLHGAVMTSPDGVDIRLTSKELCFMSVLSSQQDRLAPREALLREMEYQPDEYGDRALNSLVMRLRKKIEAETGAEAPIKTAHTVGFYFSGALEQWNGCRA